MSAQLNIVFAGTPSLAAHHLQALLSENFTISAVYTQPDRPAGRGRKLLPSAVKQLALAKQLPVFQPETLRSVLARQEFANLKPDLLIVVAYGLILPQAILDIPRFGCINVHASLLPRWRGASPINQAILAGDKETGITIMQMDAGLDTGAMLNKVSCPIYDTDTADALQNRLAQIGPAVLIKTLKELIAGELKPVIQSHEQATYAPKITKADALVDWQQSAEYLARKVRAYNSWPVCYTFWQGQMLKIWQAIAIQELVPGQPGTIIKVDRTGIFVVTGKGILQLKQIQLPGGKSMTIADILNGKKLLIQTGDKFKVNE